MATRIKTIPAKPPTAAPTMVPMGRLSESDLFELPSAEESGSEVDVEVEESVAESESEFDVELSASESELSTCLVSVSVTVTISSALT